MSAIAPIRSRLISDAMTVFIAAGEESGDRLGAALIRAIRELCGSNVHFSGVGGHAMAAEGIQSPFPIEDLAIVGFTAIPRKLRIILRRIRETADAVIAAQTDVLVIIDSPDFTHRVARRVRKISRSIPIVDYVSPSVWAWRPGRARAMRAYVDHVLALLPFEPAAHEKLGGPTCTFVGHPLAGEIATLRPNEKEA
jgi:lipid-A-disaccharide synthase